MSIEFTCGECKKRYRVKDAYAGKKIRCPNCCAAVEVPEDADWNRYQSAELLAIVAIFARLIVVSFRLVPGMGWRLKVYRDRSVG